jgi:hypothetical protein
MGTTEQDAAPDAVDELPAEFLAAKLVNPNATRRSVLMSRALLRNVPEDRETEVGHAI